MCAWYVHTQYTVLCALLHGSALCAYCMTHVGMLCTYVFTVHGMCMHSIRSPASIAAPAPSSPVAPRPQSGLRSRSRALHGVCLYLRKGHRGSQEWLWGLGYMTEVKFWKLLSPGTGGGEPSSVCPAQPSTATVGSAPAPRTLLPPPSSSPTRPRRWGEGASG